MFEPNRLRPWRRISRAFLVMGLSLTLLAAQEQPPSGVKKTANDGEYEHSQSKTRLTVPKGWEVLPPKTLVNSSFLNLRNAALGIEATVSWTPLSLELGEAVNLEREMLTALYGKAKDMKEKVGSPQPFASGGKNGFRLEIDDGPTRNGKEAGIIHFFAAGSAPNTWKLKVRATFSANAKGEAQKAVQELAENLKW